MREPKESRGKAEGKVDDSRLSAVIMATERRKNKLGKMINSSWLGRPYQRRMPETVANPRTEAQQAHRVAFGEVSRLSSAMREAHEEGLHWHAVRERLNTSMTNTLPIRTNTTVSSFTSSVLTCAKGISQSP